MRELQRGNLKVDFEDVERINFSEVMENVLSDPAISQHRPKEFYQIDPRTMDRIVYSEARAKRPHETAQGPALVEQKSCIVCDGKITSAIDVARISEGFTFINKNLYPIFYPASHKVEVSQEEAGVKGSKVVGSHFLQWPSNVHTSDFHNMKLEDIHIVLKRLALFERQLLHSPNSGMSISEQAKDGEHYGYVGVIKNMGRLVGGSIIHGHHQIAHSNVMPGKIEDDQRFRERWNKSFSQYMLTHNPSEYTIKKHPMVTLLVPYFMKRPLDAFIIIEDTGKNHLHHLGDTELYHLGEALKDASKAVMTLMPRLGRELAYNWVIHTGDIGGMYIEVLPYTQEMGGYEHLGIYLCQSTPERVVEYYKDVIG